MTERHGNDDLLTLREVAVMFRVDPRTVFGWEATGKLPAIRTPGGHLRFYRRDIVRALAQAMTERPD